jgi:hypothetical protein
MIAAMVNIDERQQSVLVVVIEKDNLDRMKQADPITLESIRAGGALVPPRYPLNLSLLLAYEENDAELYRMAKSANSLDFIKYLERGFKFKPEIDGKDRTFHVPKDKPTDAKA